MAPRRAGSRSRAPPAWTRGSGANSTASSHRGHREGQEAHCATSWPCARSPRPRPSCSRPAWSRRHRGFPAVTRPAGDRSPPVVPAPPVARALPPVAKPAPNPQPSRHPERRPHRRRHPSQCGARTCAPGLPGTRLRLLGCLFHAEPAAGILGAIPQLRHVRLAVRGSRTVKGIAYDMNADFSSSFGL